MVRRENRKTALRSAAALALGYVLAAGLYIVTSGQLAARFAADLEELHDIELYKGLAFVLVTGALLFALAYALFRRALGAAADVAIAREAILRADREALPGLLAASIAHDFKNALTVARTSAALLDAETDAHAREATVRDLRVALEHASALATDLSRAGQSSASGELEDRDVIQLVSEAVELVRHHPLARARALVVAPSAAALRGEVYPTLVRQIVTNLALNALEAVEEGGRVEVRALRDGDAIVIEVHDAGRGVPEGDEERVFEPFYTTRSTGTGLGLVSVRTCAQVHGGDVSVARSPLGGAVFRVTLRAPRRATAGGA